MLNPQTNLYPPHEYETHADDTPVDSHINTSVEGCLNHTVMPENIVWNW